MPISSSRLALATLLCFAAALTGCERTTGVSEPAPTPTPVTGTYAGPAITGKVLAGSVPLVAASVQLYAAGSTGNRASAGSLLPATLTTDANGAFAIPAGFLCPLSSTQIYVVATGGKLGSAAANANSAISLLSALGPCNRLSMTPQIVIDEATTASAAWALAQFTGPGGQIGATATNATGLANAFLLAAGLASPITGISPGPTFPASASSPAPRINALANLLNTCTAAAASSSCSLLFAATTPAGSQAPTNTLDAALNLVQNPALNVASLYALSRAGTAYAPALAAAPADWTLFLNVSGGGLDGPSTLGIASSGIVWVANYYSVASAFTALGAPLFPSGITGSGLNDSYGLAVDASDNAWIANFDNSTVTELTSAGLALSGASGFSGSSINFPLAVAIDPDTSVWFANYGEISRLSASGTPLSGSGGYTSSQFLYPAALAIDSAHNAWVANQEGTTITRISQNGSAVASASCCNAPSGIAIDQRGFVWATNYQGNSLSQVSSTLSVVSSGYTGGGLNHPQGLAIDGVGNVWVASFRGLGIAEFAGSQTSSPGTVLSPSVGWAHDAPLLEAYSIAIDASGNLWIANFGKSTLTEIVGLASPVKTPAIGPVHAP